MPPSQGASLPQSQVPACPGPTCVHTHCPASRCAQLSEPPAQADPSGWAPALPCWHAPPRAPSHGFAVAGGINQQPQAVTGRADPVGLIGPTL